MREPALGVQSLGQLRVGAPMWAHKPWVGTYFPADTPAGHELAAYATWCTTVEGNTTFYATPTPDTVARWAADAPDDLRFCCKLPKHLTHERRLRNIADGLDTFLDALEPLHANLGPIQLQLPASFGPDDLPVLADTIRHLPTAFDWAVEVRHPDFFVGGASERPLDDLLADHGVNRVILDSRALFTRPPETRAEHEAWENKPRVPVRPVATASQPIVRLIGQRDLDDDLDHWQPWVTKIADWVRAGISPHVCTHTPDNDHALPLARRFHALVAAEVPELAPLPEPLRPETQLDLF